MVLRRESGLSTQWSNKSITPTKYGRIFQIHQVTKTQAQNLHTASFAQHCAPVWRCPNYHSREVLPRKQVSQIQPPRTPRKRLHSVSNLHNASCPEAKLHSKIQPPRRNATCGIKLNRRFIHSHVSQACNCQTAEESALALGNVTQ